MKLSSNDDLSIGFSVTDNIVLTPSAGGCDAAFLVACFAIFFPLLLLIT